MTLNQNQKDLLIGTLLGDGNLQTATKGRTWRYRALQKLEHKEYLLHKYDIMKPFCTTPPIYNQTFDTRTQKTYKRFDFNTVISNEFKHYGNLFYKFDTKSGKMIKDVPNNIQLFLTPKSIAYWYMDDGNLKEVGRGNAMRICTESFSFEGVQRLKNALETLYGIKHTSLNAKKNSQKVITGYRLIVLEKSALEFRDLIQPYLVDCMKYKVSDGNKGHL